MAVATAGVILRRDVASDLALPFWVRGSRCSPKILFANQAIVTSDSGSPTLMVRIANGRMTLLINAGVRLG
jgi:hypothetical protein